MEMEKVPEAGYRIEGLPVRGLKRKLTLENVKVLYNLWKSLRKARKIIREFKPDAVVGVGGYASGPIGRVAAEAGIPLILQEQNSYAGVTNKLLAKKACKICVAYEGMERFFEKKKIERESSLFIFLSVFVFFSFVSPYIMTWFNFNHLWFIFRVIMLFWIVDF